MRLYEIKVRHTENPESERCDTRLRRIIIVSQTRIIRDLHPEVGFVDMSKEDKSPFDSVVSSLWRLFFNVYPDPGHVVIEEVENGET